MQTILVCTDFSEPANNAVEYSARLARYFSAKLVLVNAFKMPLQGYNSLSPLNMISELKSASEENLNLIRGRLLGSSYDFGIEVHAELGNASTVIKDAADTYGADLVVMGMTGGGGALKEKVIGSTAVTVGRELSVPVLIIPQEVDYRPIHCVSLACERNKMEESTLLYSARAFAKLFNAELEIVTVEKAGDDMQRQNAETCSLMERGLKTIKHKHVFLKEDTVTTALEYYFKFHETDLVIVNPKKHGLFERLFNQSVTKHLAFHSQVPLLIVH